MRFFVVGIFFLFLFSSAFAVNIKMGALAPDGTTYMKVAKDFSKEIEKATGGRVKITWYPGGVMGDEPEMVKKIRLGQLDGGGFTGYGLGIINPEIRVFELPLLFNSYEEFDKVWENLKEYFKEKFREKGVELLYYFPVGFVYIYSTKPVRGLMDLKGIKLWVWSGDPVAEVVATSFEGVAQPIRLPLPDVLTALQTKMIDSFYNLPYGAVALQWIKYIKYITNLPITLSTGGIVIKKSTMDKIDDRDKKIFFELAEKHFRILSEESRKENENAFSSFEKQGIQIIKVDKNSGDYKELEKILLKVHEKFMGKLYSKETYEKVKKEIEKIK